MTSQAIFPANPILPTAARQLLCRRAAASSDLATEHGTPLFVYSKAAMLAALAAYQRGFAGRNAQICYAMKANSDAGRAAGVCTGRLRL